MIPGHSFPFIALYVFLTYLKMKNSKHFLGRGSPSPLPRPLPRSSGFAGFALKSQELCTLDPGFARFGSPNLFLTVSDIYPMVIELKITWVPSGFSGYIWLDTKIVGKKTTNLYFVDLIIFIQWLIYHNHLKVIKLLLGAVHKVCHAIFNDF